MNPMYNPKQVEMQDNPNQQNFQQYGNQYQYPQQGQYVQYDQYNNPIVVQNPVQNQQINQGAYQGHNVPQVYQQQYPQQYQQQPQYNQYNQPYQQGQMYYADNNNNQGIQHQNIEVEVKHHHHVQNVFHRNADFQNEWMNGPIPEEKREKNDRYAIWIYLALLLLMIILVGVVNNQEKRNDGEDTDGQIDQHDRESNDSDEGRLIASSAIAVFVISFVISAIFVYVTPKIAQTVVWIMLGLQVFFVFLVAIMFFANNNSAGGVIFLLLGLFSVFMIWCFRERIRQGIILLKIGAQFVSENLSILYVPILLMVIFVVFLIIWLFGVNGVGKLDPDNNLRGVIVYFVYLLYWTMESLNGVLMVTLSQVSSKWYFTQSHLGQGPQMGEHPIKSALKISFIYHLGSIILGASILAFVQLLKFMVQAAKSNDGRRRAHPCLLCIINCIEDIVKVINKSAFIFMGQTGYSFSKSAKEGFRLVLQNLGKYQAVQLVGDLYQIFGVLIIVLICGLIGFGIANNLEISQMGLAIAVYVIISWPVAILFTSILNASTDCILFWVVIDKQINGKLTVGPPTILELEQSVEK